MLPVPKINMPFLTTCGVIVLLWILTLNNNGWSQSAVYFCSESGAIGYCYGNNNVMTCASDECTNRGGRYPSLVLMSDTKGYGAIAIGTNSYGKRVIGASAGYPSREEAEQRAKYECTSYGVEGIYIKHTWYDGE